MAREKRGGKIPGSRAGRGKGQEGKRSGRQPQFKAKLTEKQEKQAEDTPCPARVKVHGPDCICSGTGWIKTIKLAVLQVHADKEHAGPAWAGRTAELALLLVRRTACLHHPGLPGYPAEGPGEVGRYQHVPHSAENDSGGRRLGCLLLVQPTARKPCPAELVPGGRKPG